MLIFIDDITVPHMKERDKNIRVSVDGVKSVFDDNKFPLYTVLHSYMVGIEVMMLRNKLFGLESSPAYHGTTERCIRLNKAFYLCIQSNRSFFTERALHIVDRAKVLF